MGRYLAIALVILGVVWLLGGCYGMVSVWKMAPDSETVQKAKGDFKEIAEGIRIRMISIALSIFVGGITLGCFCWALSFLVGSRESEMQIRRYAARTNSHTATDYTAAHLQAMSRQR